MKINVIVRTLLIVACVLAVISSTTIAIASPGHGAGILPDDAAQETPEHDEVEDGAGMTEDHVGDETTETHDVGMAATETDDASAESTVTTKNAAKAGSSKRKAKTTAAKPESIEQEAHNDPGERYSVNSADANGYAVAVGMTLGALGLFGLALRYL